MKKYNENFERDVKWYLSVRHIFNFDGVAEYRSRKGDLLINYNSEGVDGVQAFFLWDSNGIIAPTKHPNLLKTLLKVKGSVNLHIKMYAEDRAGGILTEGCLKDICEETSAPEWFKVAIENQKLKFY
jgi:hypothetical protein